jgi:polyhydroxyalkanoate synthase
MAESYAKIRGDQFEFIGRFFPTFAVAPMSSVKVHADKRRGFKLSRYGTMEKTGGDSLKLLIVPHIVNRPYIFDLSEDVSVIGFLSRQGIDTYMIDWGYPTHEHQDISFSHYVRYIDLCISLLETENLFILGYCTGGIISLIWTSFHPGKPKGLLLLATPVDFGDWTDPRIIWGKLFQPRAIAGCFGNIPGELVDWIAMQLLALHFPQFAASPQFWTEFSDWSAILNNWRRWRWVMDSQAIPGAAYQQFLEDCYQKNLLIKNRMQVESQPVELSRIRCPLLNISALYDHIVPVRSSQALARVYGGNDYQEIVFPCTHVGLVSGRPSRQKLWPRVAGWLKERAP